jgi:uncharacterized sporulation protein YeaH/YhbH (DUF444 family)
MTDKLLKEFLTYLEKRITTNELIANTTQAPESQSNFDDGFKQGQISEAKEIFTTFVKMLPNYEK